MAVTLSRAAQFEAQAIRVASRRHQLLSLPSLLIIGIFGVLPLIIILIYSFLEAAPYGGVIWKFSTDAYLNFLFQKDIFDDTLQFTPDFLIIYLRSFLFAVITTVVCLLLGFPTAYFMATRPPAQRNWWVLLITIPFWSNLLVRTLAIMFIIRDEGLINTVLMAMGVIDKPITMLYTNFAILLGMLYSFLPFMVLPLYANLEKLDFRLIEAAYIDAAKRAVAGDFRFAARIIAGCLLVFIPALGTYVTPFDPGGHSLMTAIVAQQFGVGRDWPLGCARIVLWQPCWSLYFYVRLRREGQLTPRPRRRPWSGVLHRAGVCVAALRPDTASHGLFVQFRQRNQPV